MADTPGLLGGPLSLGPAKIVFDTATGGTNTDLGETDSIILRFGVEKADLKTSQYGTQPKDKVVTGEMCSIEFGLAESSIERLEKVLQGFRVKYALTTPTGYSFGSSLGQRDSEILKQMTVTLIEGGTVSTDPLDKITIWKVAPMVNIEYTYDAQTQRFAKVSMMAYKDDAHPDVSGAGSYFGSGVYV